MKILFWLVLFPVMQSFATDLDSHCWDSADDEPYVYCKATNTPYDEQGINPNEIMTTEFVTACITTFRGSTHASDLSLKTVTRVYTHFKDRSGGFRNDYSFFEGVFSNIQKNNKKKIHLLEKAPLLSPIGTMTIGIEIDKTKFNPITKTMPGVLTKKAYHGGRLGNRPYHDSKHPLSCQYVVDIPDFKN